MSALERLSEASGREFPHLLAARRRTQEGLEARRQALSELVIDGDTANQLKLLPTDRIAEAFLNHGAVDEGGRSIGAYDDFLGRLSDPAFRMELSEVTRRNCQGLVRVPGGLSVGRGAGAWPPRPPVRD